MKIGIIAALPGELKPLVRGWEQLPAVKGSGVRMWQRPLSGSDDEVVAVCAGMGAAAARRAFTAAEFLGAMDLVLSVGWAGALGDFPGVSIVATEIIDTQTGERFSLTTGNRKLRVVTTTKVADAVEKHRLWKTYDAVAVDMEAAVVARLAEMRGIPMCCFKGISDGADANLPDINRFIDIDGQMRMGSFLAHVALRPQYWGSLMEMGRRSTVASKAIAQTVEEFLRDPDPVRWNRQGGVQK
jgi:adenosylhomocysteine nucleosidase